MLEDKTGQRVPYAVFRVWENNHWATKTSDDYFRNKRVILFALPGAFTPVCSVLHLPSYNDLYDTFRANGIDDVICLSVNDGFVLEAWKKAEKAFKITMVPDASGEFTSKLGFLVDKSDACLGNRSWRYSMVVNDGVIEKMFIEPFGHESDPYGESSAETMLKYIAPHAAVPDSVVVFSKHNCQECENAKNILNHQHIPFEELMLDDNFTIRTVKAISGSTFLPQVFINGRRMRLEELNQHFGESHFREASQ